MKTQQMVQNLWDIVKAILSRPNSRNKKKLKIQSNLTPIGTIKSKTKSKVRRRKEKIKAETNDLKKIVMIR